MKKKLSAIIATAMILSMSVTAFAGHIEPRTPTCEECGGRTYCVSETMKPPVAPQRCDKCGVKTFDGTLKILGYACEDCRILMEVSTFYCSNCQ